MTHPFHPLFGREFEWVDERWSRIGERRVQYRNDRGHVVGIPKSWTSLAAVDPLEEVAAGRSWFRADDLVRLAEMVARMRR
ncbi:MAG: hypothetical protein FJ102_09570 [Deltaproteobacteria bacterium]|nr:hypothetical protein [Deltaproteobacteria bacterium]